MTATVPDYPWEPILDEDGNPIEYQELDPPPAELLVDEDEAG